MLLVNSLRWLLRRALFGPSPPCGRCGASLDWGQPWRRSPGLAAFYHDMRVHLIEGMAARH